MIVLEMSFETLVIVLMCPTMRLQLRATANRIHRNTMKFLAETGPRYTARVRITGLVVSVGIFLVFVDWRLLSKVYTRINLDKTLSASVSASQATKVVENKETQSNSSSNVQHSIPPTETTTFYYSNLRSDRSGAAIHDVMLARAYADQMNYTYGGACPQKKQQKYPQAYQDDVMLLQMLGLSEMFKLACPLNNANATTSVMMRDAKYRKFEELPETFVNQMKELVQQQDWFHGSSSKHKHKIVVHIRRGDVTPCFRLEFGYSRYLPNSYYKTLIERYYQESSEVVIFSESQSFQGWDDFEGYKLVLDGDMTQVWKEAIDSDVFIMSRSSFSYVPAILARGKVIYTKFWHTPQSTWEVVEDGVLWNDTLKEVNAMRRNCSGFDGQPVI